MVWLVLLISGILEAVWALSMKLSDGFTKVVPSAITMIAAGTSFWLLAYAMKSLPLGTVYAVWVGIGIIGTFLVGVLWLGESVTPLRIASAGLILIGVIGLRLSEGAA